MEWALKDLPGVSDLVEFESRLNHVLPKYEDTVICAYDYARFSPAAVADILRTHPMVMIGGILQENPCYVPPEELLQELRERIAYRNRRKELEAAALIQQGLIAVKIPQVPFAVVSGANVPCMEIGGDFFSVTALDEGVVLTIADVSGKGIAAAIMASLLQGMIHEGLLSRASLPDIARGVNEFFCARDLCSKYATLVIARVQPTGELEYLNCAHVPPLIVTARGSVMRLRESNLPVGLLPHASYESATARLRAGNSLILVTDGVTEAQSPAGDFFGDERLETCARRETAAEQVVGSVRLFQAGRPMDDDCTVVELTYLGAARNQEKLRAEVTDSCFQ
jgi:serine phosphatase RsbU (regulator of sigma subunit)